MSEFQREEITLPPAPAWIHPEKTAREWGADRACPRPALSAGRAPAGAGHRGHAS